MIVFKSRERVERLAIATALALAVTDSGRAQFTPFQAALAKFDATVAKKVAEDGGGFVSVAVFAGGRIVWS